MDINMLKLASFHLNVPPQKKKKSKPLEAVVTEAFNFRRSGA